MHRILLADPNPILRSALALLLETRLDVQIVGQVSSMESLLCEAAATQPDIVIIGMELPGEPAHERIAALRQKAPRANLLSAGTRLEIDNLPEGIKAFLCESDPPESILRTLQALVLRTTHEGASHV